MRRLADRGVVHVEVAADRAHDDVAGIEADPDLHVDPVPLADVLGVERDRVLHPERGIAGPGRVVLVRQRGPEERHDAVPEHLVDGPLVAVDGLHHELEDRVDDLPRFFRVPVRQQLHRALQVREEHRHVLALAFQRAPRGEDLLREVPGRVGLGRGCPLRGGERGDRLPALQTEAGVAGQLGPARRAALRQAAAAAETEAGVGRVVLLAAGALHGGIVALDGAQSPGSGRVTGD